MREPLPRRFDLIVFDWDGTLFDSTALIVRCIQAACADLELPVPDAQRAAYVIGLGLHDALRHAVPALPAERYPELGRRYRSHYTALQHELALFPGVLDMLLALKHRRHRLGVASGKSRPGLDEAMRTVGLASLFDGTRTADETAGKPDPRMLLELMAELGARPDRTLMIGDTTHDLQLARNAGAACIGVSYGAHQSSAFAAHAPLHVVDSIAELAVWLDAHA